MGITIQNLHLLAKDQKKHPVKGNVLCISQQGVLCTKKEVEQIYKLHGINIFQLSSHFDTKNKIPSWNSTPMKKFTNAQTIFSLLGAKNVSISDVSDFENPDYLIDLNNIVKDEFINKFDYIFDSGTLEHIYNIPTALSNINKMLTIGGTVTLILPCSNWIDHGFYSFSPCLFYEYFSANGFENFSCYINDGKKIYKYIPHRGDLYFRAKNASSIYFSATKTKYMEEEIPQQGRYSDLQSGDWNKDYPLSNAEDNAKHELIIKHILKMIWYNTLKYHPQFLTNLYIKSLCRANKLKYIGKI